MDWQARLAELRETFSERPDTLPPKLTKPGFVGSVSTPDSHSENIALGIRAHLLSLAERDAYAPTIVHRLHADDVAACIGLPDAALRAYLRTLDRGAVMDRGIAPEGYTQAAHCDGCGPVWLWPQAPAPVTACPWCFRRKAGKTLPRPQVTCGDCIHYLPDPLNPEGGMGGCDLGAARAYWPMKRHRCVDHVPEHRKPAHLCHQAQTEMVHAGDEK